MEVRRGKPFFRAAAYLIDRPARESSPYALQQAEERAIAGGVDWWVWRIVVSPHIPDGLAELRARWSFADALEGHLVLDVIEAAEAEARKEL